MTEQTETFNTQYMETVELYRTEFGIDPPADVWGVTKFDGKRLMDHVAIRVKKKSKDNETPGAISQDATLVSFFSNGQSGSASPGFPEFGGFGGGGYGGAGGGGTWDNPDALVDSSAGSEDGGDWGGDSGSSGCSSGCGGGD